MASKDGGGNSTLLNRAERRRQERLARQTSAMNEAQAPISAGNPPLNGYFGPMLPDDRRDVWVPFISCDFISNDWKYPAPLAVIAKDQKALIDTGANACSISTETAERLNLRPLYEGDSIGAEHDQKRTAYSLMLRIGSETKIQPIEVVAIPLLSKANFQILLGWPVLHKYQILLSQKDGLVSLTR